MGVVLQMAFGPGQLKPAASVPVPALVHPRTSEADGKVPFSSTRNSKGRGRRIQALFVFFRRVYNKSCCRRGGERWKDPMTEHFCSLPAVTARQVGIEAVSGVDIPEFRLPGARGTIPASRGDRT